MNSNQINKSTPVIIGEVLFDHFPDGTKVLGGAPFNVAWNLSGFGRNPLFVSAVGNDSEGENILTRMQAWGMNTAGISVVKQSPTGTVSVDTSGDEPQYDIVPHQAYDQIPFDLEQFDRLIYGKVIPLTYHGSLICRSSQSRKTVLKIKQACNSEIFVDINLRHPWFDSQLISEILESADYLKLSADELKTITDEQIEDVDSLIFAARELLEEYAIKLVWVTAGGEGAYSIRREGKHLFCPANPIRQFVDSVGAGDAFTSVVMFGLMEQWTDVQILNHAVEFASKVCSIHGATTNDIEFYSDMGKLVLKQPV